MTSSDQKTQSEWSTHPTDETPSVPPRNRRPGVLTIGAAAAVALVLALFAAVSSWQTASSVAALRAEIENRGRVPGPAPSPATMTPAQPSTATPEAPDATPTGSAPSLNAQTQYRVDYTRKRMRISAACGSSVSLDLDEPRVQAATEVAELTYLKNCSPDTPKFTITNDEVQGAEVQSDSVTPIECNEQIQLSPLPRTGLPIRQGQVYCVMTSLSSARESGQSWKMVVLSVTSVAEDDTVGLEASAWDIPF